MSCNDSKQKRESEKFNKKKQSYIERAHFIFLLRTVTITSQLNDDGFSDTGSHHESRGTKKKASFWRCGPGYATVPT